MTDSKLHIKLEFPVKEETISMFPYTGVQIKIEPKEECMLYLEELIECEVCGMKMKRDEVRNHRRNHQRTNKEKNDKCVHCDKMFKYKHQTLLHIKKVHEKDYSNIMTLLCDICGKLLRHSLTRHIKVAHSPYSESDWKKYVCEKCGKAFKFEEFLKNHYKTKAHNENTPQKIRKKRIRERKEYKCHFCDKIITSKASLTTHIRIHTGERPFACTDCPNRFRSRLHLMSHRVVHTKERPYVCKICSKSYTQRWPLKRHIKKTHHPPDIVDK